MNFSQWLESSLIAVWTIPARQIHLKVERRKLKGPVTRELATKVDHKLS